MYEKSVWQRSLENEQRRKPPESEQRRRPPRRKDGRRRRKRNVARLRNAKPLNSVAAEKKKQQLPLLRRRNDVSDLFKISHGIERCLLLTATNHWCDIGEQERLDRERQVQQQQPATTQKSQWARRPVAPKGGKFTF